jgi:peptidyl-prolyl cis-trans isomerase SurA
MNLRKLTLIGSLLLVVSQFPVQAASPARLVDRIIAVVNDEAITTTELQHRLTLIERQLRNQGTPLPPQSVLEKQMLERLIIERIQLQQARETALQIDDTQLDTYLRRVADANKLSVAEFRYAIEKDGIPWSTFRNEIRDELTISRLREREVDHRLVITDGEIDNYLATPATNSSGGEDYNIAHILLRVSEQASPEQLLRVRARAEQAQLQLKRGDDFAQVAASFSDAPDAMTGGLIGARPLDRLPGLYAEAVQKLKAGELSPILQSAAGYHIIKLIDRSAAGKSVKPMRQTHARHILIKVNELVPDAEAKRKATLLKERLDNGTDFAELARLNSNDLSATKGGDLGWLYEGDTVPEFERAMDGLKANEISKPVKSPFGWHVIQVLDRRIETASVERQRMAARQAIRDSKLDEAYQDWIRQLRDRAYVEMRLDDQ